MTDPGSLLGTADRSGTPLTAVVSADEVAARARTAGTDVEDVMLHLVPGAAAFARAPVSGFRVGALARGGSGSLYAGANLEFPGMPLGASVHAEQAAVANARRNGERRIVSIAVTAVPCGHCRQFLAELPAAGALRILRAGHPPATLAALLPDAFGPRDLGVVTEPLGGAGAALKLADPSGDALLQAACEAAARAYAPYSGTFAGVALRTGAGAVYDGSSLESAAYNPSLPPLQAALVALVLAGRRYDEIAACALVETAGAVSHRASASALLEAVGAASFSYALASVR